MRYRGLWGVVGGLAVVITCGGLGYAEEKALLTPVEPGTAGIDEPSELQKAGSAAAAHQLCERFLTALVQGEYDRAFNAIRPYFPIQTDRVKKLEDQTRQHMGVAELQFGAPLSIRFVNAEALQDSVLRFRYLLLYQRELLHWDFVFYNSGDGWVVNAMGFDDEVNSLFR